MCLTIILKDSGAKTGKNGQIKQANLSHDIASALAYAFPVLRPLPLHSVLPHEVASRSAPGATFGVASGVAAAAFHRLIFQESLQH